MTSPTANAAAAPATPPATGATHPEAEEKSHILIVDDRPDKLMALEAALADLGENIVLARSGKEGLRWLLKQDFAVILLDVNMPGLDGFETAAMIRQRPRSELTPIIFVSTVNDTDNHVSRGYSLGAVDYILSPIVPEILRAKVAVFVDLYRKTAQIKRQGEERAQLIRTEAARAEAETARERSAFLAEASNVLASYLEPEETLRSLARLVVPRLADYCIVDMIEEDGTLRQVAVAHRDAEQEDRLRTLTSTYPSTPQSARGAARVFQSGRAEFCMNITARVLEDLFPNKDDRQQVEALGPTSYIAVPLRARGRILGAVTLVRTNGQQSYNAPDLSLAEEVAQRAALALDNVRLYQAAERARREAERANQAKDQFLAMLSHELRTPLTPVLTTISLLDEDERLPADLRPLLEVIHRNVQLEARLIDDLLDLTRISKGKLQLNLETVDAHALLERALEICETDIRGKKLHLELELQCPDPWLRGDAARLQQVFWNLIKNAVKFTLAGGKLAVHTRKANDCLELEVTDTGIGIEPSLLPRIFNAFEQGERKGPHMGGLGLGLAITRALVSLHGGRISAESGGPGQGATFTASFPLVEAPATDKSRTARPLAPEKTQYRPRLLVVEDHEDTNRSLCQLLRNRGYEVESASDVEQGVELGGRYAFDVLVSDLGLPDGTGIDLIHRLRPQREFHAIALTGFGMEGDVKSTRDAGFSVHLTKPIDIEQLTDSIQKLMSAEPAPAGD